MSILRVENVGILEPDVDIVVNAANEGLQAGGGVCGVIFRAAGYQALQNACDAIGHCPTGDAVITPGFKLKAQYIIHTVGPIWYGGRRNEKETLYSCYQKSLQLARQSVGSDFKICFPLISAGIYGYPPLEAWAVAYDACMDFLSDRKNPVDAEIFFAIPDEVLFEKISQSIA